MAETIVIYRLGSMGDTIVSLPCFHKVMQSFPNSHRVALTNIPIANKVASLESILKDGNFVHDVISYRIGTRDPVEIIGLIKRLRALRAKTLIYLGGDKGLGAVYRDLFFFRLCGFSQIIGLPLSRDKDRVRVDLITGEQEYEASRLGRCLSQLGQIDLSDASFWDLRLTQREHDFARNVLSPIKGRRFLAINTGGKTVNAAQLSTIKDWGFQNWSSLLSQLGRAIDADIVFVGGADDGARAEKLAQVWNGTAINMCGQLSPREAAAVLARATAFVGHDSGPMHFAAAVQTPCVALFGSLNKPHKWHPFGSQHVIFHDVSGVQNISPDSVSQALREIFDATKKDLG